MTSKQLLSLFLIAFISINLYSNEEVCAAKKNKNKEGKFSTAKNLGKKMVLVVVCN